MNQKKSHIAEIGVLSAHHQMFEQNSKWNVGQKYSLAEAAEYVMSWREEYKKG